MLVKKILIITSICLLLLSCGSNESSSDGASSGPPTALEGTWLQACTVPSPFALELDFRGSSYTQTLSLPSAGSCALLGNVLEITAGFGIGAQGAVSSLTTYELNLSLNATATVLSGAAFFNSISLCGKNNWVNNQPVSNIAQQCSNYLIFELVGISNNTMNVLYLGDPATGNGTSEGSRPAALNLTNAFQRTAN